MMERLGVPKHEKAPEFHTPFYEATLAAYGKESPERREAMKAILDEIDKQAIGNFASYASERFPGVAFSHSKLSVTPELIEKLSSMKSSELEAPLETETVDSTDQAEGNEEKEDAKRQDYFLFTAFAPPPEGTAFTVQDVAIDRFIRLIPRVANAMRKGEPVPEVNVYMLGAPTGFGGQVTQEWIDAVKEDGLESYGKLYAEFVEKNEKLKEGEQAPHIVLQGVSKGAINAEKTSKYLPEELQKSTQRLLDNPAGDHADRSRPMRWLKGAEVAAGMVGETAVRMVVDDMMKTTMKEGKPFMEKLPGQTGIAKDAPDQSKLKWKAIAVEVGALLKGSSLDTEETRSFIRRGLEDPLTFSPGRVLEVQKKIKASEAPMIPFFQRGRSVEVPFKGHHFFIYNRYNRWSKIIDFAQNTKQG